MGLFSSKTTQETTQNSSSHRESEARSSIGTRTEQQGALMNMLMKMSQGAAGQMGDLSGLARGEMPIDEGLMRLLTEAANEMQSRETRAADMAFEESLLGITNDAAATGQDQSSASAMHKAVAGRERIRATSDAASRAGQFEAQGKLQLPFQQAGMMKDINALLYQMATGPAGILSDTFMREREGNKTVSSTEDSRSSMHGKTTTETPFGMDSLLALGQSLMGMGVPGLEQLFAGQDPSMGSSDVPLSQNGSAAGTTAYGQY